MQMHKSDEAAIRLGEVCTVINGIVKVACIDMQNTQDYFLGCGVFLFTISV